MISITSTAITITPALIAGEIVPVSLDATGMDLPDAARLYLAARAYPGPGWLLGACELEHGEGAAWTGSLNLATYPCARWFFGAGADESRRILLELVEATSRDSLLRLATTLRNSALLGCADGTPAPLTPGVTLADVNAEIAAALAQLTGETIPLGGEQFGPTPITEIVGGLTRFKLDSSAVAPDFSEAATYAVGALVTRMGTLWRCVRAIETPGPWNAEDWTATTTTAEAMPASANGNTITTGGTSWEGAPIGLFADQITLEIGRCARLRSLAPDYSEDAAYHRGDLVVYAQLLYIATADTPSPAGEFDLNVWDIVDIKTLLAAKANTADIPTTPGGVGITPETWTFAVDDGQGGTTAVTKSVCIVAAQQQGA